MAENVLVMGPNVAIAVLTNQEASDAAGLIAKALGPLVLPQKAASQDFRDAAEEAHIRGIIARLQHGQIDRTQFTADANFYFSADTLGDFASSLGPLGTIQDVARTSVSLRGGMTYAGFNVTFTSGTEVKLSTYTLADEKLEQLLVEGKE